ncbi:hypothetical protein RND61_15420 [Streptomyces sp. TRM76323]|uniref:Tyrosine specific protein phosphatases domain-containing protein n=1 Tax=Streptomyces tamarix TaxID=3078565 RepID=A0ABU3QKZ2_9ACTN|nr:hypothetical protein [Streptomyces tamarix]MDT9683438.1 hypothetical protein [Streptomyces tamarix]
MQKKMDSLKFPTIYNNFSHSELLNGVEVTDDDALILFVSMDDIRWGKDNLRKLLNVALGAKNSLVIFADDLPKEVVSYTVDMLPSLDNPSMPSEQHVKQIVRFLLDNPNKNIISSCSAGISRSGWVSFFLDVKNARFDSIKRFGESYLWSFDSKRTVVHNGYNANSAFTYYAIENGLFSDEEIRALRELPIFSLYTPIQKEISL